MTTDLDGVTLTFILPPNLANGRGHSRWLGMQKKRYFAMMDERQNCGLVPPPPAVPYDHFILDAWMGLGARMDDDNAMLRAYKWPADWLRTRGYIADDQAPACTMRLPVRRIVPEVERVVKITITPSLRAEGTD